MTQLNPMLERLQSQIQQYNKEIEATIDKVASQQNIITIAYIVFNIIVFVVLQSLFGQKEPLILDIPNNLICLIVTLLLLLASFPLASKYAKRNLKELKLNEEVIEPKMQYAGSWEYNTTFRIQSPDDGTKEYKLFEDNMKSYEEHGISEWTQNVFELKIDFANTKPAKDQPQVNWQSAPISYDEHEVRWSFNGKIWWKDYLNYANEFCGIEYYTVNDHDDLGRPSLLEGHLIGTILVGKNFYVVDAISNFIRKNTVV